MDFKTNCNNIHYKHASLNVDVHYKSNIILKNFNQNVTKQNLIKKIDSTCMNVENNGLVKDKCINLLLKQSSNNASLKNVKYDQFQER
jgi:hypothetical protein